jgi:hypothetical protein
MPRECRGLIEYLDAWTEVKKWRRNLPNFSMPRLAEGPDAVHPQEESNDLLRHAQHDITQGDDDH